MITIIGAGPAGSYLAYLLAKKGQEVTIFEEHEVVGSPVQCTGIVTESIDKFIKLPSRVIAKKLDTVRVVSKTNTIEAKTDEIVMWRNLFDQHVNDLANKAGAKTWTNHQFLDIVGKNKIKVKDKTTGKIKEVQTDTIIGADGPSSAVAKAADMHAKERFYVGMQAKAKLKLETNIFETHFGEDYPNFFGWVVPESEDTVRIGLGAFQNAKDYFYKFLEKRTGSKDVICWESGIIPVYNPKKIIQKKNVYLIGDAATQVKETTGGGIIPSCKAAHTLSDAIIDQANYQSKFKWSSAKELLLHKYIRRTLNKFTDNDYDTLLTLMNKEKVKKLLKKYDRDTPIPLVTGLLLKEPRFLKYTKFAF